MKVNERIFTSEERYRVDASQERLVILHNHLFKNAGTTIDWSLGRELGSAFVDHRDDAGMKQGAR
jgi:hypothetical protein